MTLALSGLPKNNNLKRKPRKIHLEIAEEVCGIFLFIASCASMFAVVCGTTAVIMGVSFSVGYFLNVSGYWLMPFFGICVIYPVLLLSEKILDWFHVKMRDCKFR